MQVTLSALRAARAEALYASRLPTGATPGPEEFGPAIRQAVRADHGPHWHPGTTAEKGGKRPETACPRMRRACRVVERSQHVRARAA